MAEYLAIDRNSMANERTLLAYQDTLLMFVVAGVLLIQFFSVPDHRDNGVSVNPRGSLHIGFWLSQVQDGEKDNHVSSPKWG